MHIKIRKQKIKCIFYTQLVIIFCVEVYLTDAANKNKILGLHFAKLIYIAKKFCK